MYKGVEVERPGKSLGYDVQLNYAEIKSAEDIRPIFANEIVTSLDIITTIKKIRDFGLPGFKADVKQFFKENAWL